VMGNVRSVPKTEDGLNRGTATEAVEATADYRSRTEDDNEQRGSSVREVNGAGSNDALAALILYAMDPNLGLAVDPNLGRVGSQIECISDRKVEMGDGREPA
jgi:hypothetical protein